MKLGTWLAMLGTVGCVGIGAAVMTASEGCTATVETGSSGGDDGSSSGSTSSSSSSSSSGGTTTEDGGIDPCLACEYGLCSGLYSVCISSAGCLSLYSCSIACTTDNCLTACTNAASAADQALYNNLSVCDYNGQCNGGSCAATCNPSTSYCALPTGDDAGAPDSSTTTDDAGTTTTDAAVAATCDQCQATSCTSQLAQCAAGQPCGLYNQCVLACTTSACATACQTADATGYAAAQSLGTCTSTNCPQCSQ
jgi:hypothetical protein